MKERLECQIFGRVQLVMFRDFAERNARDLNLVGFVQNKKDGSLFVVAEGEREKLNELILRLKKGPILARVERTVEHFLTATGKFNDFRIIFHGN